MAEVHLVVIRKMSGCYINKEDFDSSYRNTQYHLIY